MQEQLESVSGKLILKLEVPASGDTVTLKTPQSMKYPELGVCKDENHEQTWPRVTGL